MGYKGTKKFQESTSKAINTSFEDRSSQTVKSEWERSIDNQLSILKSENQKLSRRIEELSRDKISFITVSGIFLAVFTFISIEIQILKYLCSVEKIIGFSLLIGVILIGFIFLLDVIARNWVFNNKSNSFSLKDLLSIKFFSAKFISFDVIRHLIFVVIILSLFVYGVKMLNGSDEWMCSEDKNTPVKIQTEPQNVIINIASPSAFIN